VSYTEEVGGSIPPEPSEKTNLKKEEVLTFEIRPGRREFN